MSRATCCHGDCRQGRDCPAHTRSAEASGFAGRALLGFVAVLAVLVLCAGCMPQASAGDAMEMRVYTDVDTGCQYLDHRHEVRGIIPRIAADGHSHMGCKGGAQ